jgi:hypothetical protein
VISDEPAAQGSTGPLNPLTLFPEGFLGADLWVKAEVRGPGGRAPVVF